ADQQFKPLGMSVTVQGKRVVATNRAPSRDGDYQYQPDGDPFTAIMDSLEDAPVKIAVLPPRYVIRAVQESMPVLPEMLGGGPSNILVDGMQSVGIGLVPGRLEKHIVIQAKDNASANALKGYMPALMRGVMKSISGGMSQDVVDVTRQMVADLPMRVEGSRLTMSISPADLTQQQAAMLRSTLEKARGRVRTVQTLNSVRQILLGMHNHHSAFGYFPPWRQGAGNATQIDQRANKGLSWRVYLLPFMEQIELYQQFHLDEPWDSQHNRKLISKMPAIYKTPQAGVPENHTTLVAPSSSESILQLEKPTRFRDVLDGTSNTVMIVQVQAKHAVPWTAPRDYNYDQDVPAGALHVDANGTWIAGFGDGSVRRLPKDLSAKDIRALFGRNDGEIVKMNP
ncbi:MAG: DUF1559 domain-containing protein, partial [Planctomycetota bacterium]